MRLMRVIPTRRGFKYAIVAAISFALGSGSVAFAGPVVSGWVGITDAAGNQARVTASGALMTSLLTDELAVDDTAIPASGVFFRFPMNITGHGKARFVARPTGACTSPTTFTIFQAVWINAARTAYLPITMASMDLCAVGFYDHTFDVIGVDLGYSVLGGAGTTFTVIAYGR
jgi:hypothetical protein